MAFNYFLRSRTHVLIKSAKKIADEIKKKGYIKGLKLDGISVAITESQHAYDYYKLTTSTKRGLLLSFIPGTESRKARLKCALKLEAAYNALDKARKAVKALPKVSDPNPLKRPKGAPPAKDYTNDPKVYPSPFSKAGTAPGASGNVAATPIAPSFGFGLGAN